MNVTKLTLAAGCMMLAMAGAWAMTPRGSGALAASATPNVEYKFNYKLDDKGNAILCGSPCVNPKPEGVLVVPDKIDGHTLTKIDNVAFKDCDKMTRIVLPPHLEEILHKKDGTPNPGAIFAGCPVLASIEIPGINPNYTSENGAFYTKDKKRLVAYPKNRSQITLASETTTVGGGAFHSCMFKTAKIPDSVDRLACYAFCQCPNLEVVEFPKIIDKISAYAFEGAPNMKKVVFHGDAPRRRSKGKDNLFTRSSKDLVVEVKTGSKGWKSEGSTDLPERWPTTGSSRPIRYIQSLPVVQSVPVVAPRGESVRQPEQRKPSVRLPTRPQVLAQKEPTASDSQALDDLKKKINGNLGELKELLDKNPACYLNPRETSIINVEKKIATMKDRRYCTCVNVTFVRDAFYCSGCKRITSYRDGRDDYGYGYCKVCRQQGFYRWLVVRRKVDETAKINARINELYKTNESLEEQIRSIERTRPRK